MSLFFLIAALLAGFVVLALSGDLLVRGSAAFARRGGVPPLIVGLTIVAFGTSAPELFVSVQAVLSGAPTLALGNIVGSNITNVLVVLSIPALFTTIPTHAAGARTNTVIMVVACVAFVAFASNGQLGLLQGAILLLGVVAYIASQALRARHSRTDVDIRELVELDQLEGMPDSWAKIWIFLLVGVAGLPFGGVLIVQSGVEIARTLGVRDEFVGLTLVAFGTSLPELATSVIAATRRHSEVAIGNVVGSNIFNVFAVGGASAAAGSIPVPPTFFLWNFPVMVAAAVALLVVVLGRRVIGRATGVVFLLGYLVYLVRLAQLEGLF